VAADEKESDLRRILNFGHTIGHALESATAYAQLLHGEAVGLGMIAASAIARDAGFCSAETAHRIASAVRAFGPLPKVRIEPDLVLSRLPADKKTIAGSVHFVLPTRIGKVKIANSVSGDVVRAAVEGILV
jgi:3-dehydroquinate synthase